MNSGSPAIKRFLSVKNLLAKKSHFLFGPRQTGKTFLIRQELSDVQVYDLLDSAVFIGLSQNPGRLVEELRPQTRSRVIDEIQRLPDLLHEVHRVIESRGIRFLLTGWTSSWEITRP